MCDLAMIVFENWTWNGAKFKNSADVTLWSEKKKIWEIFREIINWKLEWEDWKSSDTGNC